jgi:hypothetical protein
VAAPTAATARSSYTRRRGLEILGHAHARHGPCIQRKRDCRLNGDRHLETGNRLARVIAGEQDAVTIAIRTGDPSVELARYTAENTIDLAIVHGHHDRARALLTHGHYSVLVRRR